MDGCVHEYLTGVVQSALYLTYLSCLSLSLHDLLLVGPIELSDY